MSGLCRREARWPWARRWPSLGLSYLVPLTPQDGSFSPFINYSLSIGRACAALCTREITQPWLACMELAFYLWVQNQTNNAVSDS